MKRYNLDNKVTIIACESPYSTKTKTSHKIITMIILIIILFFIYLGVNQIIEENQSVAATEVVTTDDNYIESEELEQNIEISQNDINRIVLTEEMKSSINNIYNSVEGEKQAYLTFDDGPSSNTLIILDILEKYSIKATFFVLRLTS